MSTVVSIILYALAAFTASLMSFGMASVKARNADNDTANALIALAVATVLFFVLAAALQVFS